MAKKEIGDKEFASRRTAEVLLEKDFRMPGAKPEDEKMLGRKVVQLKRAKANYLKHCREFIDMWVQIKRKQKKK